MGFNKNTWDKDYSGAPGLKTLTRMTKEGKKATKEVKKEGNK